MLLWQRYSLHYFSHNYMGPHKLYILCCLVHCRRAGVRVNLSFGAGKKFLVDKLLGLYVGRYRFADNGVGRVLVQTWDTVEDLGFEQRQDGWEEQQSKTQVENCV